MISLHIFRRHTSCQQASVLCFRRMLSRARITRWSSPRSDACCPTPPPPRPACRPGPSRRHLRHSRRFSPAFTSLYSPRTNTSRRIGKVFWIAWVISCRYCSILSQLPTDSLNYFQARLWRVATPRAPDWRRSDVRTSWWRTPRPRPPCARWASWWCVANIELLCETTISLLLFIFRVWEDLNSESGVWCHSPIFHQNIWNFAFPSNIVYFLFWKCLKMREVQSSLLKNIMVGGEISLSKGKSAWWIFYFPIGLTLWIIYFRISSLRLITSPLSQHTGSFSAPSIMQG